MTELAVVAVAATVTGFAGWGLLRDRLHWHRRLQYPAIPEKADDRAILDIEHDVGLHLEPDDRCIHCGADSGEFTAAMIANMTQADYWAYGRSVARQNYGGAITNTPATSIKRTSWNPYEEQA